MTRSRATAKQAGSRFEREIADYLAAKVDDRIDRKVRTGAKDTGDIGGVRLHGRRVALELKHVATMNLPAWTREAQIEAGNDDALVGLVVHKRHGNGRPGEQWVSCTVDDLVAILTGQRPEA